MTYWQVFNAHGRMYLAEGDTAAEAIENARPLFASNWLYGGPGLELVPNPAYAQVGMAAVALTVDVPDGLAETVGRVLLRRVEAQRAVLPGRYLFNEGRQSAAVVSPGCREASFGWVHVKPSCRCSKEMK